MLAVANAGSFFSPVNWRAHQELRRTGLDALWIKNSTVCTLFNPDLRVPGPPP